MIDCGSSKPISTWKSREGQPSIFIMPGGLIVETALTNSHAPNQSCPSYGGFDDRDVLCQLCLKNAATEKVFACLPL